jgi:hypothetical protein
VRLPRRGPPAGGGLTVAGALAEIASGLLGPVAQIVDELHTSEAEKLEARRKLFEAQAGLFAKLMDYETRLAEGRAAVIRAEAQGQGALQRNWRPIAMLTFLVLVVCDAFGLLAFRLAPEAWTLLQIGLGGYVVGRSVEKVAPALLAARGTGREAD